ncbi:MAG: ATP-binding protein [Candidatus Odinarchaeota archaeon]
MFSYFLSIVLNSIFFFSALIYHLLKAHQNNENKQGNLREYKKLKIFTLIIFLSCLTSEFQVINNFFSKNITLEILFKKDSLYIMICIWISNILLLLGLITFLLSFSITQINQIALPYPSRSRAKHGQIELGRIKFKNKKKYKFKLSISDLERHMFICGATGSGKTNFHQRFLIRLNNVLDVPFMLCEFKGEYTFLQKKIKNLLVLKPGFNFFINIFDPEGADPKVHAERLFQAFRSGMKFEDKEFTPQMERVFVDVLVEICKDENNRTWEAFKSLSRTYISKNSMIFNRQDTRGGWTIEQSIFAIQNRIRRYFIGTLSEIFVKRVGMKVKDIFNNKVIVDLSSIINLGGDKIDALFFLNLLLKYLYDENIERGSKNYRGIKHITILEDSQYFAPQELSNKSEISTYIEDIALLLRGTGECLITLATRPALSEEILANCGVLISFKEHMQKNLLGQLLNLEESQERYLSELGLGQCIIRVNSIEQPFSLIVPHMKREELNDDKVIENNRKILEKLNPEEKRQPLIEYEKKTRKYCQYCGSEIIYGTENNICGFCEAYFEDEKKKNKLRKVYREFKDLIDCNTNLKRLIDE